MTPALPTAAELDKVAVLNREVRQAAVTERPADPGALATRDAAGFQRL